MDLVISIWQILFEQIHEERRSAANLLSLMSFFNPRGILELVLCSHTVNRTARGKEDDEDLDVLRAYSLVTVVVKSDMCEMHQLVQFCTRVWPASFNEVERWRRKFPMLMAREFPVGRFKNWVKCQTLLPHVESILEREPADEELLEEWAEVLSNAVLYTWTKGSYKATGIW